MEFSNPWLLLGIPLLLLPWLVVEFARERRRTATLPFPRTPGRSLPRTMRASMRRLPALLRFAVLGLILFALAGPRLPSEDIPVYKEGIDIAIVFDISTSMKALDFEPSDRFTVARETIANFIEGRENDRIGLVVFAGEAFTQCPLTLDRSVLLNILNTIRMDVIADGTAIGDALATAVNRLRDSQAKSKVIILLTDGANNRGSISPEKAARTALEFGVRVHAIQVGTGGVVPYPSRGFDFLSRGWVNTVQQARVPVNPELLRKITEETRGRFFVAGDSAALKEIFDIIDGMEKTELPGEEFIMYDEVYGAFALPALLILLLEVLIRLFVIRKFP